jgi:hypothetical protein
VEKMIFDLVAKATLNERYGPRSKPLRPFQDFAELEGRGEDPRSLRARGLMSVRKVFRRTPILIGEPQRGTDRTVRGEISSAVAE